jgi:hypothetical protein
VTAAADRYEHTFYPRYMTTPRPATVATVAAQVRPVTRADERILPVPPALAVLLPNRGLRRGTTVVAEAASLQLALLGPASQAGAHLAVVNHPTLGLLAAAEAGVRLDRCYLVPNPGSAWPQVTAVLLEAIDLVVLCPPPRLSTSHARRLNARAQAAGAILLSTGPWPDAELVLTVRRTRWYGLGAGDGHLRARRAEVVVTGRRAAGPERRAWLWLPAADGRVVDAAAPTQSTIADSDLEQTPNHAASVASCPPGVRPA